MITGIPDPETGITRPGTGIADPGDLFFFVTHYPCQPVDDQIDTKTLQGIIKMWTQPWRKELLGFERSDFDEWSVGIYVMGRKRERHTRINPWIIHSHPPDPEPHGGVHMQNISLRYLNSKILEEKHRIEILTFAHISQEERKRIVDYASSKIGAEFDFQVHRHAYLTYVFGLPNILHDQNRFSCQQLVISAYAAAGIYFPHPYRSFPKYNIGKILRHPLGHQKYRVNPKYPYLMDHHIYRDPRFLLKAALYWDSQSGEIKLETRNLQKYSWNKKLRDKYLGDKNGVSFSP